MNSVRVLQTKPAEKDVLIRSTVSCMQCQGIRNDLADCVMKSDCVLSGRSGQECIQEHVDELPKDCQAILKSYVHCKRGMVRWSSAEGI